MWIVFGWLIWMLVSALVANSKNRSAIGWALLSIPFGVFATIVVACSSKLPPPGAAEAARAERLSSKTCPRCAETVKAAAQVCRFCGHTFDPSTIPEPTALPWILVEDWGNGYGMYEYKGQSLAYRESGVRWQTSQFDNPEIAIKSIDSYVG